MNQFIHQQLILHNSTLLCSFIQSLTTPASYLIEFQVSLLLLFELEVGGEDIIHEIVKVGPINQSLSLVAWVHGGPTELVVSHLTLHEAPHGATHHRHWFLAGQDQDFTYCINFNSLAEELACRWRKKYMPNERRKQLKSDPAPNTEAAQWLSIIQLVTSL